VCVVVDGLVIESAAVIPAVSRAAAAGAWSPSASNSLLYVPHGCLVYHASIRSLS
jgi:hypothetical protein